MADAERPTACFRLAFVPPWNGIDDARRFAESFCIRAGASPARASEVAMATHELLQNAVTYASPLALVRFRLAVNEREVSLNVSNETAPEHASRLERLGAKLAAATDPLRHFAQVLEERPATGSGLGLARVFYEGDLKVEVKVRGRKVTIRAAGALDQADTPQQTGTGGRS